MVYIKANNEIIKVYQNVITSKKERVEWNGDIVIRKNAMILVGRLRSMYFELSSRRVYSDIEEFSLDPAIKDNILLTNIINMMLYPFVKWGAIKGINVEKDYMVLAALFSQIFKEIDVQTYFTKTSMKFFNDEIQITFEDAMEMAVECLAAYLHSCRVDGETIPVPSSLSDIDPVAISKEVSPDEPIGEAFVNMVSVDVEAYAKAHFEKSVRIHTQTAGGGAACSLC